MKVELTSLIKATENLKIRFKGSLANSFDLGKSRHMPVLLLGSKQVQTANYATKHLLTFYSHINTEHPKFYSSKEQESVREHTATAFKAKQFL